MPITDKNRKILWARSGNCCAICRISLVVKRTELDFESVVSEECHIISASPNGPRYDSKFPADQFDALENFILLCATHHKMIDDQLETYTTEVVRSIKRNHEAWVETQLRDIPVTIPVRVRRIPQNIPVSLPRIRSGKELLAIAAGSSAHYFNHDDDLSEDEVELVGGFIQEITDWIDLHSDLEPLEHIRASKHIQELISELEVNVFYVFAAKETQQLEGGVAIPSAFLVLHLSVLRTANPEIHHIELKSKA
jgi:hypothetical protein